MGGKQDKENCFLSEPYMRPRQVETKSSSNIIVSRHYSPFPCGELYQCWARGKWTITSATYRISSWSQSWTNDDRPSLPVVEDESAFLFEITTEMTRGKEVGAAERGPDGTHLLQSSDVIPRWEMKNAESAVNRLAAAGPGSAWMPPV